MHRGQKDFSDVEEMAAGAARAAERRGSPATQPFVIGRFVLDKALNRVQLYAIEAMPGSYMPAETKNLTACASKWYRWRTRPGAWQWLHRRIELATLMIINIDQLDVTLPEQERLVANAGTDE